MTTRDRTPDDLEALLPWHLNGTLRGEEAARVQAALEHDPRLRRRLRETSETAELVATRPTSDVLVAYAAGELDGDERQAVADYLAEWPEERELAALAEAGLVAAESATFGEGTAQPRPKSNIVSLQEPRGGRSGWILATVAASVLAVAATAAWWIERSGRPQAGEGGAAAVTSIRSFEVLPEDLALRSAPAAPPSVTLETRDPVVLVLIADLVEGGYDHYVVQLEAGPGVAPWRSGPLQPDEGSALTVLFDPTKITAGDAQLLLFGVRGDQSRLLHRYRLRLLG